jgi:hypothetical protein
MSFTTTTPEEPSGIGGWLILPIIGFVIAILRDANDLLTADWKNLSLVFSVDTAQMIGLRTPLAFALLSEATIIVLAACCLSVILSKRPRDTVVTLVTVASIIGAAIWIPYFRTQQITSPLDQHGRPLSPKGYSSLMLAARMTWAHFSVSSASILP